MGSPRSTLTLDTVDLLNKARLHFKRLRLLLNEAKFQIRVLKIIIQTAKLYFTSIKGPLDWLDVFHKNIVLCTCTIYNCISFYSSIRCFHSCNPLRAKVINFGLYTGYRCFFEYLQQNIIVYKLLNRELILFSVKSMHLLPFRLSFLIPSQELSNILLDL